MTTDNRTNEPTGAQIEAAALAICANEGHNKGLWPLHTDEMRENHRRQARAALVAAQGAAPQAGAYDHCCQHPKCPGDSLCCCASEQRLRNAWNQWTSEFDADAKQAFRDGYQAGQNDPAPWTAPVLPSSTVDEDALAEVVREAEQSWHLSDEKSQQSYACGAPDLKSKYIARAVAEWLNAS